MNSLGGSFYRLWDHLGESVDEYFTGSHVEQKKMRSSLHEEDKALVQMESESEKGRAPPARRSRQWRTQTSDVPPLLSSEVHKVHNYEKGDHRERDGKKRSRSPQSRSHRKRSKTDSSRNEQVCIL